MHSEVNSLFNHIGDALAMAHQLLETAPVKSKQGKELLLQTMQQASIVKRAFSSTGLDSCLQQDSAAFAGFDKEIQFEVAVATREIQWRLRDIARNLALHSSVLSAEEAAILQPLIVMFDEGR